MTEREHPSIEPEQPDEEAERQAAAERARRAWLNKIRDMELLDEETRSKLPALYSGEEQDLGLEALAPVKYFLPGSNWTWYAAEGSPIDEDGFYDTDKEKVDFLFFGLVSGYEDELGYFTLSMLEGAQGPLGLPIERDLHYEAKSLRELKEYHDKLRGGGG